MITRIKGASDIESKQRAG